MEEHDFDDLTETVVDRGLCTGCGTCIGVCPVAAIDYDPNVEEPTLRGECTSCGLCYSVCPGMDIPLPEMEETYLGESRNLKNELLGVSRSFLKGYAQDPAIRHLGASGGLTTALLLLALDRGFIDGAMVTTMDPVKPWRTMPILARTKADLMEAAKSKYAICPNNMALRDTEGVERIAVVGLPCHVHGIRKVQSNPGLSKLAEKVVLILGIFCGSNWSYRATERMIEKYSDIKPEDIERFEYRGGNEGQDVKIFTRDKNELTITTAERRWVFQCMEKERCRVCCDWSAEVADLSLGDIFDPSQGGVMRKVPNWNSVVVRSAKGEWIIEEAQKAKVIEVTPLDEESFYGNIGFELKKTGAVYRLLERRRYGWPVPNYHYEFTWQNRKRRIYAVPEG